MILRILLFCCAGPLALAQSHEPLHLKSPVEDKNFYLLSMIQRTPEVRKAMEASLLSDHGIPAQCGPKPECFVNALKWSDEQIATASKSLRDVYRQSTAVKQMVDGPLRASGVLVRANNKSGADLLAEGWIEAVQGINRILDVYGAGQKPRYPEIDSVSFDVHSPQYGHLVELFAQVLEDDADSMTLFFEPSLRFALALLEINDRDEAGRLEPMESGENAAAVKRMKSVQWEKFPYSVIVVPGAGPDTLQWSFSPSGRARVALAAKRFREGKAPFILVSGGYVHPNQTPYCEALEMKKALIADFGIPAEAILIDPHARHTTTNIRNAAREIYRYAMPFEKKALITTDPGQSASIENPAFAKRCLNELGYEPAKILARISGFDLEFLPAIDSLQMDPTDPLDP